VPSTAPDVDPEWLQRLVGTAAWPSLFPIPPLPRLEHYGGRSPRLRARHARKAQIRLRGNKVIATLNAMNRGFIQIGRTTRYPGANVELLRVHRFVTEHVLREATRFERARRDRGPSGGPPARHAAASPTAFPYVEPVARSRAAHAPLIANLIAEPADEHVVDMLAALPARDRLFYELEDNVVDRAGVTDEAVAVATERFGFIGGERVQYLEYLLRADIAQDLWHYDTLDHAKAICGFSTTAKKNGTLRKLLMAVPANLQWCDPRRRARLGLHGGAALGVLHAEPHGWQVSAFDANNAFTRVRTPRWMWAWFSCPPVLAAEVWPRLPLAFRSQISAATLVVPQYTRLAMGSSHSVNILMSIGAACAAQALHASQRLWADAAQAEAAGTPMLALSARLRAALGAQERVAAGLWIGFGAASPAQVVARQGNDVDWRWDGAGANLDPRWNMDDPLTQGTLMDLLDENLVDGLFVDLDRIPDDEDYDRAYRVYQERVYFAVQAAEAFHQAGGVYALVMDERLEDWDGAVMGALLYMLDRTGAHPGTTADGAWTYIGGRPGTAPGPMHPEAQEVWADMLRALTAKGTGITGAATDGAAPPATTHWGRRALPGHATDELLTSAVTSDPDVTFLNEDVEAHRHVVLRGGQAAHYLHVDDGVVVTDGAAGKAIGNRIMHSIADAWEEAGFLVADRRECGDVHQIVGYAVEERPAALRVPPARAVALHDEIEALLRSHLVWREDLQHTLGVWMRGAVLDRALLPVPHALCRQPTTDPRRRLLLWTSARAELRAMQALIPMMSLQASRPFGPALFATDARGERDGDNGAFGVVVTEASQDEAHLVYELCRCLSYTVARVRDDPDQLRRPEKYTARAVPRSRLPAGITRQERWRMIEHGSWYYQDHINLGELRTVVRLMRRLGAQREWCERKVLSLQDNSTCAGALTKGRSPSPAVNRLCRQLGAVSIACCMKLILPWVETTRQTADSASRL